MKEKIPNQLWTDKPHNFLWFAINFTRYTLTEQKLITSKGFFNIKEDEIFLYRVYDKKLELPLFQRLFGLGTITLYAKDKDAPDKVLHAVRQPRKLMALLDSAIEVARDKNRVYGSDMYGALGSLPNHVVDENQNGIPDELEDF